MVAIEPPLCIVDIGNGCEAFSPTLYIPAKLELTTTMQSLTCSQFFLQYNLQYIKMSSFVVFQEMTFEQLTTEELAGLHAKVQTLEPMNMKLFNEKLKLMSWPENQGILFFYISKTLQMIRISFMASLLNAVL